MKHFALLVAATGLLGLSPSADAVTDLNCLIDDWNGKEEANITAGPLVEADATEKLEIVCEFRAHYPDGTVLARHIDPDTVLPFVAQFAGYVATPPAFVTGETHYLCTYTVAWPGRTQRFKGCKDFTVPF